MRNGYPNILLFRDRYLPYLTLLAVHTTLSPPLPCLPPFLCIGARLASLPLLDIRISWRWAHSIATGTETSNDSRLERDTASIR